jgi:hypothetical protein
MALSVTVFGFHSDLQSIFVAGNFRSSPPRVLHASCVTWHLGQLLNTKRSVPAVAQTTRAHSLRLSRELEAEKRRLPPSRDTPVSSSGCVVAAFPNPLHSELSHAILYALVHSTPSAEPTISGIADFPSSEFTRAPPPRGPPWPALHSTSPSHLTPISSF